VLIISVSYSIFHLKYKSILKLINLNLDTSSSTQGWKIGGIAMGAVTCIIGVILILLTIFKQARNRPWQYKKKEKPATDNDYYGNIDDDDDDDDDDQVYTETFEDNRTRKSVSQPATIHSDYDEGMREMATSPMADPSHAPSQLKTLTSDLIFCPGCNRMHPSAHQCMYATRVANGFAAHIQPVPHPVQRDSIAIQTDDDGKKKKKIGPHGVIDRSIKYSNTTETQTDVSANPRSNITESVILRRVPIPTARVVVQQPTTKVMIVKVPNIAGQLIIQPRPELTDEKPK
jgi:hypothetical protein